ncbi:thrombospondin-2-like [Mercenaria mercenaria]|uniref:thrombospondin-2-like n=1 Tax=Mercenaria mercenaria TaxID=6596 RepID=UPI00234E5288|nr:thrombospondin-2-like [Mercenaria mercenaria]
MKCYSLFVFLVSHSVLPASCLDCFSCQHVDDPAHCNTSAVCGQNEFCYLDGHQGSYALGCSSSQNCGASAGSLVGRSFTEFQIKHMRGDFNAKELETRQSINCHECCSTDGCNKDLCKHLKPTQCVDDESVDCARMSTLISICQDIHKAKNVCPRFCNLCNLVDGQWGQWTAWSECDVTCNTGVRTRARSCTNPSPANGGLDCVGKKIETIQCHKETCPVHGGWSGWSDWGSCSATCDIGLERRDRTCSNPWPSDAGDHCYGDAHEDRICSSAACTDGAWSRWSHWGACSGTCGVGIRSKTRTCSNP